MRSYVAARFGIILRKGKNVKRIGIFGGTFNPIHSGHVGVALKAAAELNLDRVLVVPAARNPFKEDCGANALRWTLVEYACAPHPVLEPCDIELKRGAPSYTIDTVHTVKAQFPDAQLFFIVGEDNISEVSRWREADELARLVTFVPYQRTPESSTEIRRRLEAGETVDDLVPETVADFLEVKGVVFDFGGVISLSPLGDGDRLRTYCESVGLSRRAFDEGWRKYRAMWDGGECSFNELYCLTFENAGLPPPTPDQLAQLWHFDAEGWVRTLSPMTLSLMKDLKAAGKKIGILSNMSEDFRDRLFVPRCAEYIALADAVIISGAERLVKPNRPIYDLAARRLGLTPHELLFLDDTEANVTAARRWGWRSHVYHAEVNVV